MANPYVNKVDLADGSVLIDLTSDTVAAGKMLSGTTAHDKSGAAITGNIATKTSADMEANGKTVTAPAGYYASAQTKDVSDGTATTPATTVTANPTISVNSSTGVITATASATKSVTPTVVAGYVSTGTSGTITVSGSNTSQLTTQAAQTITPGTTDQTIASGKYLTGTQTIKGDANLVAGNIKKDVTIFGVTGTHEGGGGGGITPPSPVKTAYITNFEGSYKTNDDTGGKIYQLSSTFNDSTGRFTSFSINGAPFNAGQVSTTTFFFTKNMTATYGENTVNLSTNKYYTLVNSVIFSFFSETLYEGEGTSGTQIAQASSLAFEYPFYFTETT